MSPNIREQKLLYHLTPLDNIASILKAGLLPRTQVQSFTDVADHEILASRKAQRLDEFVPFHWFAGNPFDGRVQLDHRGRAFVLITVRRALAARQNWKVIPRHPLASSAPEVMDFQEGFDMIDWELMRRRDYHDDKCKSVCMAECLCPGPVQVANFWNLFVPNDAVAASVRAMARALRHNILIDVNPRMFVR